MKQEIPIRQQIIWGALLVLLSGAIGIGVWSWYEGRTRQGASEKNPLEGLQRFGTVPDFSLTERSGRKVSLADLKRKVWVVLFFYTGCRDTCPLIVPQMGLLHLEYKTDPEFQSEVRLVSITVDPELWLFLTGDEAAIYRLAQEGFRVGIGEQENPPEVRHKTGEEKEIFHSSRLILVDRKAQIRGYYSGVDAEAMVRLRRDLKKLLQSKEGIS